MRPATLAAASLLLAAAWWWSRQQQVRPEVLASAEEPAPASDAPTTDPLTWLMDSLTDSDALASAAAAVQSAGAEPGALTSGKLAQACRCPLARAMRWVDPINEAMRTFGITGQARQAAFLAQVGHESGALAYVREIWGPTAVQLRYEGRADLGNTQVGDGKRYMGRGLIQTTGRANYRATAAGLRAVLPGVPDFEADPAALELPRWAAMSAAWYWSNRGLNALADAGDFRTITLRINGGLNGYPDRLARWDQALETLA